MTRDEWESLCDGCGKCCLLKLEDCEFGQGVLYRRRVPRPQPALVPMQLLREPQEGGAGLHRAPPGHGRRFKWLPKTCAYRLVAEGKDLAWWHPLVSGDPETVHRAGISVRGRACSEEGIDGDEIEDHIVKWTE